MDDEILPIIIVGLVIWGLGHFLGWWGPSDVQKLRAALQEANDQIAECNIQINDARDQAWVDYDTMGTTLENLNECSPVADPTQK